jgi:aquaporin related protein
MDVVDAPGAAIDRAVIGEFLATFLFLFIAMAVPWNMNALNLENNPATHGIAVSFIAVAVIYSFADISGAHFNPAVTFATMMTGKTAWKKGTRCTDCVPLRRA